MDRLAQECVDLFLSINFRLPDSVLEPGSGDGYQLQCFKERGLTVQGIEPSRTLTEIANQRGCNTTCSIFNDEIFDIVPNTKYDIVISSYTFDHSPDPINFLETAHKALNNNGLLCLEVHEVTD